jgi:hypothetical protein
MADTSSDLARARCELAERQRLDAALGPEAREELFDLRTRRGEHHEWHGIELAERSVDEPHGGEITPVEILEDEEHRLGVALGHEEVFEGATHLVTHQHRLVARGAELHAGLVGKRHAAELAQKIDDARSFVGRHVTEDPLLDLLPPLVRRVLRGKTRRCPERLREDAEGGARAHRIAAPRPDLHRTGALQLPDELVNQTRLAHARGGRDQDGARDRLRHALLEDARQECELALSADDRGRYAEHGPVELAGIAFPYQGERLRFPRDLEPRIEEGRGHVVDAHEPGNPARRLPLDRRHRRLVGDRRLALVEGVGGAADEPRGALDHLSHRHGERRVAATRRDRDRGVDEVRADRERASRRLHRLIPRRALSGAHHDERPVGEHLEPAAESLDARA